MHGRSPGLPDYNCAIAIPSDSNHDDQPANHSVTDVCATSKKEDNLLLPCPLAMLSRRVRSCFDLLKLAGLHTFLVRTPGYVRFVERFCS